MGCRVEVGDHRLRVGGQGLGTELGLLPLPGGFADAMRRIALIQLLSGEEGDHRVVGEPAHEPFDVGAMTSNQDGPGWGSTASRNIEASVRSRLAHAGE